MRKSIWIKALELKKMTNTQLAKYEINTRIADSDEPSDHELLKQLAKNQASDHELLMELAKNQASDHELLKQLVTKVNNIETRLTNIETRLDNLVKKNNLIE